MILIYITFGSEQDAKHIASQLMKERLVTCANIFPIQSMYWWNDAIQNDNEWVAIVKTTNERWDAVRRRVEELHSYEVPCVMKIEVEANAGYEEWIRNSTT